MNSVFYHIRVLNVVFNVGHMHSLKGQNYRASKILDAFLNLIEIKSSS